MIFYLLVLTFIGMTSGMKYNSQSQSQQIATKISDAEGILDELDGNFKNLGLLDLSVATSTTGDLSINLIGTYLKAIEIGEVYEKYASGDPKGSLKDLVEAVVTLCLFDIPGVVTPAAEVFQEIMEDLNEPGMHPLQQKLHKVNKNIRNILKKPKDAVNSKVKSVSKKLHQARDYVGDELGDVLTDNPKFAQKVNKASKMMKASGKAMTKVGGSMNALSIMYAGYKFGEAIVDENYNDAIEQGLVIVGSMFSLAATYAAAGSALGPIGVVVGALFGAAACIFGLLKPDPEGELAGHMKESNIMALKSLSYLRQDFAVLPKIVQSIPGEEVSKDWLFEANQSTLRAKVKGMTPNGPLKFTWQGISKAHYVKEKECKASQYRESSPDGTEKIVKSGKCVANGNRRSVDKAAYDEGAWFNTMSGSETFDHPNDFYGYISENKEYTGTTIFVRTNLLKASDKIRSININTEPPSGFGQANGENGDDSVVLYDMSKLDITSKINLNLAGGNDSILIHGLFGVYNEARKNEKLVDISFSDQKGSVSDFGGIITFAGMSMNKDSLSEKIKGIEFTAATNNARGKICYLWNTNKKSCPIVTSKVAILGASPFNDIIHMDSEYNLLVINEEGVNEYVFKVRPFQAIRTDQIIDKESSEGAKIRITLPGPKVGVIPVYIVKEEAIEFYWSSGRSVHLAQRVIYKGSSSRPFIEFDTKRTTFNNMLRGRSELSRSQRFMPLEDGYNYNQNTEVTVNDGAAVCLCKIPTSGKPEGYWTIRSGDSIDHLVVSQMFITHLLSNDITAQLVSDFTKKVSGEYVEAWSLEIRKKNDLYGKLYPRYDVRLDDIDVVVNQDGIVLFDLTNPEPLTNQLDLISRYKSVRVITMTDRGTLPEEDRDSDTGDYILLEPGEPGGDMPSQKSLYLGDGTNTIVYDYDKNKDKDITYQIATEHVDGIYYRFLVVTYNFDGGHTSTMILGADRFVCQFSGGIQRDLPQLYQLEGNGRAGDLNDDCGGIDISPFKGADSPSSSDYPINCLEQCE